MNKFAQQDISMMTNYINSQARDTLIKAVLCLTFGVFCGKIIVWIIIYRWNLNIAALKFLQNLPICYIWFRNLR